MKQLAFTLSLGILFIHHTAVGQIESEFTDPRDGITYPTVILKYKTDGDVTITKEWFSQNLNYESDKSFCYKSEPAYCDVFGKLYLRNVAASACPSGWHLSTSTEWQTLIAAYGGLGAAGGALNENGDSGLNLQMGGFGDNGEHYQGIGANGYYWSAKGNESELITVDASEDVILYDPIGNANKNSIRCVKDY